MTAPTPRIDPDTEAGKAEPEGAVQRPSGAIGWYLGLPRRARLGLWLAFLIWLAAGALFINWAVIIADRPDPGQQPPDEADLVLLVAEGISDERPAMALLHRGEGQATVVLLAPGTVVEVPGLGPKPLVGAYTEAGPDALATAVANELQIRVPRTLIGSAPQVAALVDHLGGVTVDVPATIEVEQERILRRLYTQGPQSMDGTTFSRFLTMPVERESELDRLTRQDAAYRGLLGTLRDRPELPAGALEGWGGDLDADAAARVLIDSASIRDLQILSLPVVRQPIADQQLYRVDTDELEAVVQRLEQVRTMEDTRGRRLRLLIGADGAVGPVIGRELIEAGFRIEVTQAASESYDVSRVVIPLEERDRAQGTADRLLEILGTGKLAYERHNSTYFDATVVVGRDWAVARGFPQATPNPRSSPRG